MQSHQKREVERLPCDGGRLSLEECNLFDACELDLVVAECPRNYKQEDNDTNEIDYLPGTHIGLHHRTPWYLSCSS